MPAVPTAMLVLGCHVLVLFLTRGTATLLLQWMLLSRVKLAL